MENHQSKEKLSCLTFNLGEENFALPLGSVNEVLDYMPVTKVPRMPDFLQGVVNLRGNVVPIIELRAILNMPPAGEDVTPCIVIMEISQGDDMFRIGALVDAVQEVVNFTDDEISPPPRIGMNLDTAFIHGLGKRGEDFVIILNVERVFSSNELEAMQTAGNNAESASKTNNV